MPEENVICSGIVERIGFEDAIFQIKYNGEILKKLLNIIANPDTPVAAKSLGTKNKLKEIATIKVPTTNQTYFFIILTNLISKVSLTNFHSIKKT